jgi:AcrR family transcriptional regulator
MGGMPVAQSSPRSAPARSTRARPTDDELLDAARSVFAEQGFRNTTMSAIAARSNSTKPTLYAHFGDKDALYATLLEREAAACRALLFDAYERSAALDLDAQVSADTVALFDFVRTDPDAFALLFGGDITSAAVEVREKLLADINDQIALRLRNYQSRTGAGLRRTAITQGDRQLAAMLVGVAVNAAQHAMVHRRDLTRACRLASAFSTAALSNLRTDD